MLQAERPTRLATLADLKVHSPKLIRPWIILNMRTNLTLAVLLLSLCGQVQAAPLTLELMQLGPSDPTTQSYNLQEQRDLRVFARSAADFKQSKIFWQQKINGQWQAPQRLPFSNERWRDSDPHLSNNGKTLVFISDRPVDGEQALGQLDLYESTLSEGKWSAPQRLSESLQSKSYELGPERYGNQLYFGSYRKGGPGKVSIYRSERLADGGHSAPVALPAPVNVGPSNSDFTLSPDGRFALWWSDRDAGKNGSDADIFLAERVGADFGPAIRLPAPINGPGFEFTPSVSSDGQWLIFASTRSGAHAAGLSQLYRVSWPALLKELGPRIEAHSQLQLDQRLSALWQAIGHKDGAASNVELLGSLLHPQARIWGQSLRTASLDIKAWSGSEFLDLLKEPKPEALYECEVHRELRRYGAHAEVYSVVESRRRADQTLADSTGVNSSQWQLGPQGWQLLSLHYAMELPGQSPPPRTRRSGDCIG
ncbi:hypothetical protein FNU76_11100 [Chitinimonas arctica]|uniref:DUF4440 domain-containing protein n=1 Tax=Chitinimonas arctica TaxID=2594795 RepID=A0A516SFC3_9NEIS|nr:PD40 domain-containing protein [Chitinimonas arctica]QDQ26865.1 hypothetical protein FNU76_11100 [Chitinimonas arctica]